MRTKNTIKNSITSFISNVLSYALIFISQTIFIKILGIEYLGLNGLFSNILTVLNLFELGIGSAITFKLYKSIATNKKEEVKSLMHYYKKCYFIIALVIFIIGLLITPFITFIVKDVTVDINIYIIYILFLTNTISTYYLAHKKNILFAHQKNYIINIIHIIYIVLINITQLLIIFLTHNYYLYLIVKIIYNLVYNITISIKANKEYPYIKDKDYKPLDGKIKEDITNRVKALILHKICGVATDGTDNILISIFFGIKSVGLYANYNYIMITIDSIFRNIIQATRASVGDLLVKKDYGKRYRIFSRIRFLNMCIVIITAACLLNLMEPFITLWLGKEFLLTRVTLIVLIINYCQSMMRATYRVFKDSAGIWIEDKYIPLLQLSINLITSIILLKIIGLPGVFVGTILSSLVLWLYSYPKYVYNKILHMTYRDYYAHFIKCIIFISVILLTTYIICINITTNILVLDLFIKLLISVIIPFMVFMIVFRNNNNYRYYKGLIKYRFVEKK